ncbi:MAG: acetylserotonin O-methyltransferase [Actinomycetota bacterium]|nr:acetylserotonin O-methyltransferase [Actinomycetota bacterium]
MADTATAPPAWLVDGIGRLRKALTVASRAAVPADVALLEITQGAWLTQALYATVHLGIADALRDGPLTAEDAARRVGTHPDATHRLMRALASNGVLTLRRNGRFGLTRLGRAALTDRNGSMASMIAMVGHPDHWEHWAGLVYSVRTGETAVQRLRGAPIFEYLDENPFYAAVFNDAMTGVSTMAIETAVPRYDFTDCRLIVDVGGGHGALLAAVLARAPQAHGVLYDLPSVIARAGAPLDAAGVASRCRLEGGDFFESVPDGADTYVMNTVIHDWDDEKALTILRNVRTAIASGGKLLLMELVLPEGAPTHPGMLLDLEMLVQEGGRERTADEYRELLRHAGFTMTRVISTTGPMSIVEAVPAQR